MTSVEGGSLGTLGRLCAEAATGELICATEDAEVHVHLQEGRVAWATSSNARFAFARHVVEECGIDKDALRELVLECQRERKPLGETLIEWGLATQEQVRSALQQQVRDALATLPTDGSAATVFLRRGDGYAKYDRELTFALEEVAAHPTTRKVQRVSAFPPRLSSRPPPGALSSALELLVADEAEIHWAEQHTDGQVVVRAPRGTEPRGVELIAAHAFRGEVDFVAIRSEQEGLLGFHIDGARGSVMCGLSPDTVLGAVLALVRERLASHARNRPSLPGGSLGPAHMAGDRGVPRDALMELFERTRELWAVAMVDRRGGLEWLGWREHLAREEAASRLAPLNDALNAARALHSGREGLGFSASSMVASTPFGWFFGSEVHDSSGRDLWLVLDPEATQGLGWALLTALLRRTSLTSREVQS